METWEYATRVVSSGTDGTWVRYRGEQDPRPFVDDMNRLGLLGWEVVGVLGTTLKLDIYGALEGHDPGFEGVYKTHRFSGVKITGSQDRAVVLLKRRRGQQAVGEDDAGLSNLNDDQSEELYRVVLIGSGSNKINVIKAIRELTGLDLTDAKRRIESLPKVLATDLGREAAESMAQKLRAAGATVHVRAAGEPAGMADEVAEAPSSTVGNPARMASVQSSRSVNEGTQLPCGCMHYKHGKRLCKEHGKSIRRG